ncbi:MAG TPA: hypothetical protein VGS10_11415 [Terracidiphilus sp.]|nr:hypothetical protein [Terracidiphilus sp.]
MWYLILALIMFVGGVAFWKHRAKIKAAAEAEATNLKNSAANEVKKL